MTITQIDPTYRSIEIDEKMSAPDLYSQLKEMWVKETKYLAFSFPLQSLGGGHFSFIHAWRFADKKSNALVSPSIYLGEMEPPPLVPSKYRRYENVIFTQEHLNFEDVLRNIPKNIPHKSIQFKIIDGQIAMVVGGVWPNDNFKSESQKHNTDSIRWAANYRYRKDLIRGVHR